MLWTLKFSGTYRDVQKYYQLNVLKLKKYSLCRKMVPVRLLILIHQCIHGILLLKLVEVELVLTTLYTVW